MNISTWHSPPQRRLVGLTLVVLFHAFIIHAPTTGLAKRVIDVVHAPVETKVIEEINKPPPLADIVPPPRFKAAPPPFIPPPELHIAAPPVQNTISAITSTPPPAPVAIAPIAPPVVAALSAPPTPPAPVVSPRAPVSAAVVCSNYATVMDDAPYPREAQRAGIDKGESLIQFTLDPSGQIKNIKVIRASHPIFARNSVRFVSEYKCQGQGRRRCGSGAVRLQARMIHAAPERRASVQPFPWARLTTSKSPCSSSAKGGAPMGVRLCHQYLALLNHPLHDSRQRTRRERGETWQGSAL